MAREAHRRRLILISHPRTASNLLMKMLNMAEQTNVLPVPPPRQQTYFFSPGIKLLYDYRNEAKPVSRWTEEERISMMQDIQQSFDELLSYVDQAADEDKVAFFKVHGGMLFDPVAQTNYSRRKSSPTTACVETDREDDILWPVNGTRTRLNNTLLPDDMLKTWFPTFVIKHPALAFPSFYRVLFNAGQTEDEIFRNADVVNTYYWTMSLYKCFKDTFGITGIILDADDFVLNPTLILHYCEMVGLDATKLKLCWNTVSTHDEAGRQRCDTSKRSFFETLNSSGGVLKDKVSLGIDLQVEAKKWRAEFGEHAGAAIENWVQDAMEDYEFLRSKSFRP